MAVLMAGIDHTRAALDVRSVFSFTKKRMAQAYADFKQLPGLDGCVILSTCNRMEFYLSIAEGEEPDPVELLCNYLDVSAETYGPYFTTRREREAVDHLFRLAAGMESRIVGEDQIITQVGDALDLARANYASGHTLEVLFRLAVTGAKRVKTEAAFTGNDKSVIHTALRQLKDGGVALSGRKCLVIGNGMMGRISAQALMDEGADVTVTVRQYRSGVVDIPRGARRISYDERFTLLPECDLVVSATSSPNYTIEYRHLEHLSVTRPILLIDLAVPRDIDPEAGSLPWATLYDTDSFRIDRQSLALREALARAQRVLDEEEEHFYTWYEGRDVVPQIQRLKAVAGSDVSARLIPTFRRARLPDEQKTALSSEVTGAAERMMNRLIFGLKGQLPENVFRQCLDAMETVLSEK